MRSNLKKMIKADSQRLTAILFESDSYQLLDLLAELNKPKSIVDCLGKLKGTTSDYPLLKQFYSLYLFAFTRAALLRWDRSYEQNESENFLVHDHDFYWRYTKVLRAGIEQVNQQLMVIAEIRSDQHDLAKVEKSIHHWRIKNELRHKPAAFYVDSIIKAFMPDWNNWLTGELVPLASLKAITELTTFIIQALNAQYKNKQYSGIIKVALFKPSKKPAVTTSQPVLLSLETDEKTHAAENQQFDKFSVKLAQFQRQCYSAQRHIKTLWDERENFIKLAHVTENKSKTASELTAWEQETLGHLQHEELLRSLAKSELTAKLIATASELVIATAVLMDMFHLLKSKSVIGEEESNLIGKQLATMHSMLVDDKTELLSFNGKLKTWQVADVLNLYLDQKSKHGTSLLVKFNKHLAGLVQTVRQMMNKPAVVGSPKPTMISELNVFKEAAKQEQAKVGGRKITRLDRESKKRQRT